jgi:hypothetical protein
MSRSRLFAGALAAAALAVPTVPLAQHAAKSRAGADAGAESAQVAVDAQGKVRAPTREEVKALLDAMPQLQAPVETSRVTRLPGGAVKVDLSDRFESVSIARVASGKAEARCVETKAEAERFLRGELAPKPAAPALEER